MEFRYFRCDWEHGRDEDPVHIFYEVDEEGRVPRLIDVYDDGRVICESVLDLVGLENVVHAVCLVEGSFLDTLESVELGVPDVQQGETLTLSRIDPTDFHALWRKHRPAIH